MADDKTLSVTFTMHLTEPLTEEEKDTIIGNLWEHIYAEREEGILGFAKIDHVDYPGRQHRKYAETDPRIARRLGMLSNEGEDGEQQ